MTFQEQADYLKKLIEIKDKYKNNNKCNHTSDSCFVCKIAPLCDLFSNFSYDKILEALEFLSNWKEINLEKNTRQYKFLQLCPNFNFKVENGCLTVPPCDLISDYYCIADDYTHFEEIGEACDKCIKDFWLAKVETETVELA